MSSLGLFLSKTHFLIPQSTFFYSVQINQKENKAITHTENYFLHRYHKNLGQDNAPLGAWRV